MWLEEKCVSTLSHFMSHAKFSTAEMQHLYALQVMHLYKIKSGYFIIDDTMRHHTNYCKWIHGAFVLFDHALKTNLKAVCIVVFYYSDGESIRFPVKHEIYYKDTDNMPWQQGGLYYADNFVQLFFTGKGQRQPYPYVKYLGFFHYSSAKLHF